jgi:type II secretory pathway predicted ATPase ExeA
MKPRVFLLPIVPKEKSKMDKKLLALYGLKYNPFSHTLPVEALSLSPALDNFCWRIENVLLREGGFALVSGESGTGKSVALRLLANRLSKIRDVRVGAITHSSSRLSDFYRELGDIFEVALNPSNRWGGFKKLRDQWTSHLQSTLIRPILFIDEVQEMPGVVLNELRLLASLDFDSQILLSVIFAGDQRFNAQLRREDLVPLGTRIKMRFQTEHLTPEQLRASLEHVLLSAGNPSLMTSELIQMLCEHAMGNYRALNNMADQLLATAAERESPQLDEKLFFEYSTPQGSAKKNHKQLN